MATRSRISHAHLPHAAYRGLLLARQLQAASACAGACDTGAEPAGEDADNRLVEVRMNDSEEYFISFDTKSDPPNIDAVRVRLDYVKITDMNASMRIDLADHPLYMDLQNYVKANPR